MAPGSAAADGAARRDPRRDEPFLFQPVKRGVDGTGRDAAFEAVLDFLQDGAAITFAPKGRARVREREENSLFKGAAAKEVSCESSNIDAGS
jgi:hypothetical protein